MRNFMLWLSMASSLFAATHTQAAARSPSVPLAGHLRELCTHLKQQGWAAPKDISGARQTAEFDIPGVAYFCNLERTLKGAGPGHSPVLQALISDTGAEPSIVFSADIWCAQDRVVLATLAEQIEKQLTAIALPPPAEILAATRDGRKSEANANGLRFKTAPIDVDAQACSKVRDNELGAVLMKIDVSIEPQGAKAR